MPQLGCTRCQHPLDPVYPGQAEHPLCSPTDTGWIPRPARQAELPASPPGGLAVALELAALGRHLLPLSPATKRPLGNCPACRDTASGAPHSVSGCPCLPAGRWCHGVRAATTDPARLTRWWHAEPDAVPAIAAGPSGLVLVDIDAHADALPPVLATGLLPGIDLTAEPIPASEWDNPGRYHDGRDTLRLLTELRGGPRPWPPDPGHQPLTVTTPSGGRHLWYQAPAQGLRQALSDPHGHYGLAWQIDIKAGWSYGIAPGASTRAGRYQARSGNPAAPGHMPPWLAREIIRVTSPPPRQPGRPAPAPAPGRHGAAYLTIVISRGAAQLATMTDGRKRALSALAYQAGGLLAWSGLPEHDVTQQLTAAGTASGLPPAIAARIARRAIANGITRPVTPPMPK
jgi:hypothetical protein